MFTIHGPSVHLNFGTLCAPEQYVLQKYMKLKNFSVFFISLFMYHVSTTASIFAEQQLSGNSQEVKTFHSFFPLPN